ncbi:MAG: 4Fe-4S dicluster domain-containing protein [Planctomycetes bacterium]|nr:4Fe-4S dicluster domain-containing protein [Planctomycetota bacterium]
MLNLTIDDQKVSVEPGKSVLDACQQAGIKVPTLCHHPALPDYGACRLCLVEVEERGRKRITASCTFPTREGLIVRTNAERVVKTRRIMAELLLARCPNSERVKALAAEMGVTESRFPKKDDDCILCGLCVRVCDELMKNGAVDFRGRGNRRKIAPAYDKLSPICMACGACQVVCPTAAVDLGKVSARAPRPILSEFNADLGGRPSIYIPYPQAIPKMAVIDRETCMHFRKAPELDACRACEKVCGAKAIDYNQQEEVVELDVGAVVIAPGFQLCDHTLRAEYGFGQFPNVISSLQFERVLSASGPYQGHVQRPSDAKEPKRIASIQCVGSREDDANYCSSVCCMYAVKHALMAKEHLPGLEYTIFFMDLRAYGKGFDAYYQRAQDEGVRFVRARPATVQEAGDERNLRIKYLNERGEFKDEEFDLVVLSCGIRPAPRATEVARRLGLERGDEGYCLVQPLAPLTASRPGVFVAGAFSEPKDIPETVMQASGAAARAMGLLADARGTLVKPKEYPPERDVAGEEPRIGVFVCHCGRNIGGVVNVPGVVEYARSLPNVVYAEDNLYSCSTDSQAKIRKAIEEHKLNRVIVASCTPRTHEPLFRDTMREAGLNPYLFEMANIRDQCSWVHMHEPQKATAKAIALVRMAVAKARLIEPLAERSLPLNHAALVVGGGVAGMTAALALADEGFSVHLVEREAELGGHARHVRYLFNGEDPQGFLAQTVERTLAHPRVTTHLRTSVAAVEGFLGNFKTKLSRDGATQEVEHGAVVVATGADVHKPAEYLYGQDPRVVTQVEFEQKLAAGEVTPDTVVMIQCVGSREGERPYCSRICCAHAIRNALKLKELRPQANVFVLYRDMRTYGFAEHYYRLAREKGVRFIRYEPDHKPTVVAQASSLCVEAWDPILERTLAIDADLLVLSTAVVPTADGQALAQMLKVPLNQDRFFLEAHLKLRPVDFATEGVFLAGLAHSPKQLAETIAQATAAASRAATILAKDYLTPESAISEVVDANCDGCAYCIDPCPYHALTLIEYMRNGAIKKTVEANEALCKGCGVCQATCPKDGIFIRHYRLTQIAAVVEAALVP